MYGRLCKAKMAKEAMVKCVKCGKKVTLSSADIRGRELVCSSCRGILSPEPEEARQEKSQPRIKMKCNACSYMFAKTIGSKSINKCPYCGSANVSEEESAAEKLLSEDEEFEDNRFFQH